VSDIARTAAHARQHPEEAEESAACRETTRMVADMLRQSVAPWSVEQIGRSDLIKLVTGGREYRVVVMGGEKL
jgi:hypothetical protein